MKAPHKEEMWEEDWCSKEWAVFFIFPQKL